MADKDYSHRDVLDKIGVTPGDTVALAEVAWPLDEDLRVRVLDRAGQPPPAEDEAVDLVLLTADKNTDAVGQLALWKGRLRPAGGVWVLTPKRGQRGYVDQRELIVAGLSAGLVDNKSCSVSDTVSGLRFVIRRRDRPMAASGQQ